MFSGLAVRLSWPMKLRPAASGEYLYAVAIRDGSNLWLTLWVRRARENVYVMVPRAERKWTPHASYHADGALHVKSYGLKTVSAIRQPLTGAFKGTESVWCLTGHDTNGVICDPASFAGVVEVDSGVLGPHHGTVCVDLVEPGAEPLKTFATGKIIQRQVFCDASPCVAITIWSLG